MKTIRTPVSKINVPVRGTTLADAGRQGILYYPYFDDIMTAVNAYDDLIKTLRATKDVLFNVSVLNSKLEPGDPGTWTPLICQAVDDALDAADDLLERLGEE